MWIPQIPRRVEHSNTLSTPIKCKYSWTPTLFWFTFRWAETPYDSPWRESFPSLKRMLHILPGCYKFTCLRIFLSFIYVLKSYSQLYVATFRLLLSERNTAMEIDNPITVQYPSQHFRHSPNSVGTHMKNSRWMIQSTNLISYEPFRHITTIVYGTVGARYRHNPLGARRHFQLKITIKCLNLLHLSTEVCSSSLAKMILFLRRSRKF